eukprot:1848995-Prymnesium_polylepis.1
MSLQTARLLTDTSPGVACAEAPTSSPFTEAPLAQPSSKCCCDDGWLSSSSSSSSLSSIGSSRGRLAARGLLASAVSRMSACSCAICACASLFAASSSVPLSTPTSLAALYSSVALSTSTSSNDSFPSSERSASCAQSRRACASEALVYFPWAACSVVSSTPASFASDSAA